MEIQKYFKQKKKLYNDILNLLENSENYDENFLQFIEEFNLIKVKNNKEELEHLFRLVTSISNNFHRFPNFYNKINKIIEYFGDDLKKTFTNQEIFDIFETNKFILILLLKKEILIFDDYIYKNIFENNYNFFLPEIKNLRSKEQKCTNEIEEQLKSYENYEEKRQIGENDSYICSLIRQDSIEEFVSFITRTNFSILSSIQPSIFETNCFLIDKKPTLIEYAAFFGSIQIFQYLRLNNAELTESLWFYTIHSKNAELIHFLETDKIKPPNNSYEKCLEEAIKCHHNDIAEYIKENYIFKPNKQLALYRDVIELSFKYNNYFFYPEKFDTNEIFSFLYENNYNEAVDVFIDDRYDDIEEIIILKKAIYF